MERQATTSSSSCGSREAKLGEESKQQQPRLRPTVLITTYCTNALKRQQAANKSASSTLNESSSTAACESTDFFAKQRLHNHFPHNHQGRINRPLIDLSQIKGPTGSVRGHKDVVRKSLEGIRVAYSRRSLAQLSANYAHSQSAFSSTFLKNHQQALLASGSFASLPQQQQQQQPQTAAGAATPAKLDGSATLHSISSIVGTPSLQQIDELYCAEYLERLVDEEQSMCVAYTTTLGIVRRTFEDSKSMRSILNLNLIQYEERDIYLNQEYKQQLRMRMRLHSNMVVPVLFVDGQHVGGIKELEAMNESGQLAQVFAKFKMSTAPRSVCACCGNAKFIACPNCNGSRKSTIHHFKFNSIALRCIKCDTNDGLVQCPKCCQPQANETNTPEAEDEGEETKKGKEKAKSDSSGGALSSAARVVVDKNKCITIAATANDDENNNNVTHSMMGKIYLEGGAELACGQQVSSC